MFEALKQNILLKTDLPEEEFRRITSIIEVKNYKKKETVFFSGKVCNKLYFVSQGCLRSYTIDENGVEHTMQFAFENYWISDLYSYVTGKPAVYNIEALEPSEVFIFYKDEFDELLNNIPQLERHWRILLQNAYLATQERLNCTLSVTADKQYEDLIKRHPNIAQRVPQIYIASYLGITPESLSRIRKKLITK